MITFLSRDRDWSVDITSLKMYPDSNTIVQTKHFDELVRFADTIQLQPGPISEFIAGLSVVDGIRAHGGHIRNVILPYIPGARQDRANPTGDVGFMLATVGRILNAYEFDSVRVVDPHSEAARDAINNMVEFPLYKIYQQLPSDMYDGVIAPDKGAQVRAAIASGTMQKPLVLGEKLRDVSTGKLSGFDVKVEAGRHYIVIDDICDGGGTFLGLGEKIKEQEATADLYVTHGIFSKGTAALNKLYGAIYTTNSRHVRPSGVETIDVLSQMRKFND